MRNISKVLLAHLSHRHKVSFCDQRMSVLQFSVNNNFETTFLKPLDGISPNFTRMILGLPPSLRSHYFHSMHRPVGSNYRLGGGGGGGTHTFFFGGGAHINFLGGHTIFFFWGGGYLCKLLGGARPPRAPPPLFLRP